MKTFSFRRAKLLATFALVILIHGIASGTAHAQQSSGDAPESAAVQSSVPAPPPSMPVVFHFLRQALGLQTTPTNQTLIGLSLVLTFFLMQPVGATIYQTSVLPLQEGHISAMQALERGATPVRQFMLHYVREKDVALFVELSKEPRPRNPNDLSLRVIAPAYILSELRMGFQIGTVLFLPFLVIDMVVASISTSVGMLQLPPVVISTPLKLLLFVMVDGWNLLIGSLMRSFN